MLCGQYRHLGNLTGLDEWTDWTTKWVGRGWEDFKIVLGHVEGQIFGVKENGDLVYYFHRGLESGTNDLENEGHPVKVGNGWDIFKTVF